MGDFQMIENNYKSTADVDGNDDIYYRITDCGDAIRSIPGYNKTCICGSIYIDKDILRLVVVDFGKFEAIRKIL